MAVEAGWSKELTGDVPQGLSAEDPLYATTKEGRIYKFSF